jgi:predicted metal-dependent hydrolase
MEAPYAYTLIRSRRKTAALRVTRDAAVEVLAPLRMPKREIDRFVAEKERWIASHLEEAARRRAQRDAFALRYGGAALFFGAEYPISARGEAGFDGVNVYVPAGLDSAGIKQAVTALYRRTAKQRLTERTAHYAAVMDVSPSAVKISGAKSRWGSCSGKNSINFSWRLIMAPESVIDYVVVHELAHMREHNHSPRFWARVAQVLPDYKRRQAGLRLLQLRLAGQDWT